MNIENVKWELGILYKTRAEIKIAGRDDYSLDNRIDKLQKALDSHHENTSKTVELKPSTKNDDEIPF
jgi:hypothetical protein